MQITPKKAEMGIVSDKIDFKSETTVRERMSLYNEKRVNLQRYNNYK